MALLSTLAQLEEVQAAITAVMNMQSYATEGALSVARAKLAALTAREEILLARYRREQGTRPVVSSGDFSDWDG